jgi:cell division topological specificity factor
MDARSMRYVGSAARGGCSNDTTRIGVADWLRARRDYLPLLRRELLDVIRKYVNVDPDAIQINLENEDGHEVLELSVALPEKANS